MVGILSLPVTAYFLDDQGSASWIIPVTAVAMALVGAVVGRTLPGLAGAGAAPGRALVVGAGTGVAMVVVGVVVFFLLLSGFDKA